MISLDLPGGVFGGGYKKYEMSLFESFAESKYFYFVRRDSHKKETYQLIKEKLDVNPIDFLFIDGDHTYTRVKKDFEMYSSLVANDGMIALHDICPHPLDTGVEVNEFWEEIKKIIITKK